MPDIIVLTARTCCGHLYSSWQFYIANNHFKNNYHRNLAQFEHLFKMYAEMSAQMVVPG